MEEKTQWKKVAIGAVVVTSFTLPIFRSGGRTGLTFWGWVINHSIFGPPIQFVPEESYTRELEGVEIPKQLPSRNQLDKARAYYQISEPSARELLSYQQGGELMAYTSISITAPSSAVAGNLVTVQARIRNLTSYDIEATATMGRVDSTVLRFGAIHKWLSPGQSASWYDSFIMPDRDVLVSVESWVPDAEGIWGPDDRDSQVISLAEVYAGIISRKELEYNESRANIPAYDIPEGQRGLVHIWGRNDTPESQRMGIYWFVADPDGMIAEEYGPAWEAWPYTGAGKEHEFIGGRFNLDREKYTMWVELLMNPDDPEVVDRYIGDLCTVAPEIYKGSISRKELEYDETRGIIPVY